MLNVKNLSVKYGNQTIIDNFSAEFPSNSICAVVGKNGCGKTTLLKAIDKLVPCQGQVEFDGVDVLKLTVKDRAKTVAYLPQTRPVPQMLGKLFVEHGRFPHLDFSKKLHNHDVEVVEKAIALTGTEKLVDKYTTEMSGGELQRIYVACALAQETPVVLFDEPTTHLDLIAQREILSIMKSLKEQNKIVLTVLHDIVQAFSVSDYVYIMDNGNLVASGVPQELYDHPCVEEIFGYSLDKERDESAIYQYKLTKCDAKEEKC